LARSSNAAIFKALMFIRERPEEAADIAFKKIPMGDMTRPMVVEGIRRFGQAFPEGVPVCRRSKESRLSWNLT
jgi:hypothetical protein